MKRNLGPLSVLTAGLVLSLSVPAFSQELIASVNRSDAANHEARKPGLATAEEHRAEISRLQSRRSALQKYISSVDPASNDFLVTARTIREIDVKLKELNAALQTVVAEARKLTLAQDSYLGKYRAQVKLKVDPTYTGNIKITVIDRLGNEVFSNVLSNLERGVNNFTTRVDLTEGQNIVVASRPDDTETSNSLVLLGGDAQPQPEPVRTARGAAINSSFVVSRSSFADKISLEGSQFVCRTGVLKIAVDDATPAMFPLKVTVKKKGESFNRSESTVRFEDLTRAQRIDLIEGTNVVTVTDATGAETASVEWDAAACADGDDAGSSIDGYPVALSLGGVVVSQQAQNFNQADPFFGFIAGYTSQQRAALGGWRWNLRFQGIFTAAGRTAQEGEQTDDSNGGDGDDSGTANNDPFTFIASRKSFDIDAHMWIDLFDKNKFTIGPYVAWGASTVMDKNELQGEAVVADRDEDGGADTGEVTTEARSDNDLKQFREAGMLMNLRFGQDTQRPKLLLQAILAHGWYEGLKDLDRDDDSRKRFIGKLRVFPEGLGFGLNNTKAVTPMFGVEVNAGPGPDQVKFFTGFAVRLKGFSIQ